MFDDKINMQVPFVNFRVRELGEWTDTNTDTYFKNKRVIVFSLPGAFTPTCSLQQLPGYEKQASVFKEHGIDEIYCMSVNDSFDGNGQFTQEMGMLCQKRDKCFGQRAWRYAMIVNNGIVEKMFVEPGKTDDTPEDPYGESSPENVLKYLQENK